ncbi:hypothetical protein ACFVYA_44400 [Amycolatopsis sp. NPDC058278]|uniref:hypothetical protein n=1 Tax=Amycolatopsis sp. NPDC058278 TaxID=3346417 RepID=UPI0036DC6793
MNMTAPEVNFSDLQRDAKGVVHKLEHSASRAVRIRRRERDQQDLVLVTADRAAQTTVAASATARIFIELMKQDAGARALLDVLPAAFPWVRYLSQEEVQTFLLELIDVAERSESLGNPAPLANLVAAWRSTAEVHPDPELAKILAQDGDDFGDVPEPGDE